MRFLFCFLAVLFSLKGFSQFDNSNRSMKIKPMKRTDVAPKSISEVKDPSENTKPIIKYESSLAKNGDEKILKSISILPKKEEKSIMELEQIRNISEVYTKKLNKKRSDGEILEKYKSDTFLGDFRTGSKLIKIACRDHEYPDGDVVRIWLNDKVAVNAIQLETDYREIYLDLNEGINKVEIEALNQGESGPNTAQFTVTDKNGLIITNNKWNLTTGVKAKLIITKIIDDKEEKK
jgi:hypothetical protein